MTSIPVFLADINHNEGKTKKITEIGQLGWGCMRERERERVEREKERERGGSEKKESWDEQI